MNLMPFAAESQSDVESTALHLSNFTSCGLEWVFRQVDFPAPAILMIPTQRWSVF